MSFNEPDLCIDGSACMNISISVSTYKAYMQPFAGKALLGAPAITSDGSSPGWPAGVEYLNYFLGNCTGCNVDLVNMHWYSNVYAGVSYLKSQVEAVRAVAGGRPIWITEFGLDYTEPYTQAQLQDFLVQAMEYLDAQPDVHRYAYFMDSPGALISADGSGLSTLGQMYYNQSLATDQSFKILSAYYADSNVTALAKRAYLSGNSIVVDTSCLSCALGGDPWWGTPKTFSMLFSYDNDTYTLVAAESSGMYTVTSATLTTAAGVTKVPSHPVPSGVSVSLAGATWGNQSITALGTWNSIYQHASSKTPLCFGDGLFGTDNTWGNMKSGVVWYTNQAGTLKAVVQRDLTSGSFVM